MSNSFVADISAFEALQNQANESMGKPQSQMGVFNAPGDVKVVQQACNDLIKVLDETIPVLIKREQSQAKYERIVNVVVERRKKEEAEVAAAARQGNPAPQKAFEREETALKAAWARLVQKQAEFRKVR